MAKPSLRTSKEVYDRLKWSGEFPVSKVRIGYEDRINGIQEIPFSVYVPGGRIPWSRVQYFRLEKKVIWDRQDRIDLVFGSGESSREDRLLAPSEKTNQGPSHQEEGLIEVPAWKWKEDKWVETMETPPLGTFPPRLKVVSYNVLMDKHFKDKIRTEIRVPALMKVLREEDADLICLQEIENELLGALLSEEWIRKRYWSSSGPDGRWIHPYGQLILSKIIPTSIHILKFSSSKQMVSGRYMIGNEELYVTVLHLTSDWAHEPRQKRQDQLRKLFYAIPEEASHLICGDFNYGDEYEEPVLQSFSDSWLSLNPEDPGFTFDPPGNPVAALFSKKGLARRLDRIIFRSEQQRLFPLESKLLGNHPIETIDPPLFISDHYGLTATFKTSFPQPHIESAKITHRSAVVIIPPPAALHPTQSFRMRYDNGFERWTGHITLLYGFIPESFFPEAANLIERELEGFPEFEISLERISYFQQKNSILLYLSPDQHAEEMLKSLQGRLKGLFPQCIEQDQHGSYQPHFTIGSIKLRDGQRPESVCDELNKLWQPVRFTSNHLHLISRRGDHHFATREVINWADSPSTQKWSSQGIGWELAGCAPDNFLRGWLMNQIGEIKTIIQDDIECDLHLTGSMALGTMLSTASPDLIAVANMDGHAFFDSCTKSLSEKGFHCVLVPSVSREENELIISNGYSEFHLKFWNQEGIHPDLLNEALIREKMQEYDPESDARTIIYATKIWAIQKKLIGIEHGLPGPMAWTIMALASKGRTMMEVLDYLNQHDWSRPIYFTRPADLYALDDPMQVLSPSNESLNLCKHVTMEGLDHVRQIIKSELRFLRKYAGNN